MINDINSDLEAAEPLSVTRNVVGSVLTDVSYWVPGICFPEFYIDRPNRELLVAISLQFGKVTLELKAREGDPARETDSCPIEARLVVEAKASDELATVKGLMHVNAARTDAWSPVIGRPLTGGEAYAVEGM